MKKIKNYSFLYYFIFTVLGLSILGILFDFYKGNQKVEKSTQTVWSKEKASEWYAKQKWITGANFIPSNAINEMEMWQKESFDPAIIDKELGYAESIGFNTMRVFLFYYVWEQDSSAFLKRIDEYLSISDKHRIKTMFVLFDNVWNPIFQPGKQPEPIPFLHNSGWLQCPGAKMLRDTNSYSKLCAYVKSIIGHYRNDSRVIMWDIYNEPSNSNFGNYPQTEIPDREKYNFTMLLMKKAFKAARECEPSQPLTTAVWIGQWGDSTKLDPMDKYMLYNSDIISFHCYDSLKYFKKRVESLRIYGRPIVCTEYMARTNGSTFQTIMPYTKEDKIGAINWGLVSGKTQTIYPWETWRKQFTAEPKVWFHDVFRPDGTPFDKNETDLIKSLNSEK